MNMIPEFQSTTISLQANTSFTHPKIQKKGKTHLPSNDRNRCHKRMYFALQQPYEGIFKIEEGVGNHVAHPFTQLVGSNAGLFPRLPQTELINDKINLTAQTSLFAYPLETLELFVGYNHSSLEAADYEKMRVRVRVATLRNKEIAEPSNIMLTNILRQIKQQFLPGMNVTMLHCFTSIGWHSKG